MAESLKRRIIVDETDTIIGYKQSNSLKKDDWYRVSALWITNSKGNILLAKRHHSKSHHPGKWGPAVAGTVDEGETYEENIIKEAEEELGLRNIKPTLGPKTRTDADYCHFTQWYLLNIDIEISLLKIQEDEVEKVRWFSPPELHRQLQNHPDDFLPTMKKYFALFSSNSKKNSPEQ
ncbi:MAG TPA: NUDIX domain-containing protein [Candidatus Nanoarchaeia archaeon]|nr:NUDIX domain-containing protein [Candidatus Nanoarchaeia archaeon]